MGHADKTNFMEAINQYPLDTVYQCSYTTYHREGENTLSSRHTGKKHQ